MGGEFRRGSRHHFELKSLLKTEVNAGARDIFEFPVSLSKLKVDEGLTENS